MAKKNSNTTSSTALETVPIQLARIYRPQTTNLGVQRFKTERRIDDDINNEQVQETITRPRQDPLHCQHSPLQTHQFTIL